MAKCQLLVVLLIGVREVQLKFLGETVKSVTELEELFASLVEPQSVATEATFRLLLVIQTWVIVGKFLFQPRILLSLEVCVSVRDHHLLVHRVDSS